ncbi:hypothetical protein F5Y18DRAFT_407023 [Xylariaceae sp. FL1019]|nr:hypothetical protein F5Y18DRAFT_407023 [Xylariaceae sp. FL1019]
MFQQLPTKRGIPQLPAFDVSVALHQVTARHGQATGLDAVLEAQAFVVADTWQPDMPVIYVSDGFLSLTGYARNEVLGRNCRMLQAPNGSVQAGAPRTSISSGSAFELKQKLAGLQEFQHNIVNFKKDGSGFINSLTVVPVPTDISFPRYLFGFSSEVGQDCDLHTVEQLSMQPMSDLSVMPEAAISRSCAPILANAIDYNTAEDDFDMSLLDNIGGLVLVMFPHGTIHHISSWCRHLGYTSTELYKASIDTICHPLDVSNLLRQLKQSSSSSPVEALIRIKHRFDGYTWFHFRGSAWRYGARKLITLVGLPQPDLHLDRQVILQGGELNTKDIWLKLSMAGLILAGFGTFKTTLGLSVADLTGITFFTLISDSQSRQKSQKMLGQLRASEAFAVVLCLNGPHSNRFQAKVTFYAGNAVHPKPHFALAQVKFIKSLPHNYTNRGDTAEFKAITTNLKTADNLFGDLDPNTCGVWQSDLRSLRLENSRLEEELEVLLQKQSQRRRCKKQGLATPDCANCHTRVTPEWRKGPGGKRNLCNACGLRWAKQTRRVREAHEARKNGHPGEGSDDSKDMSQGSTG